MRDKTQLEKEIGQLIIDCLNLEDISLDNIDPEGRLFGEGLGLDSIDALELSMAISNQYGIKIKSDDNKNEQIFASLSSLAAYIDTNRNSA